MVFCIFLYIFLKIQRFYLLHKLLYKKYGTSFYVFCQDTLNSGLGSVVALSVCWNFYPSPLGRCPLLSNWFTNQQSCPGREMPACCLTGKPTISMWGSKNTTFQAKNNFRQLPSLVVRFIGILKRRRVCFWSFVTIYISVIGFWLEMLCFYCPTC